MLPVKKPERIVYDFGFRLNDFYVLNDTIRKGDTFGSLIEKQNLYGKQVYDVIAQVKDSFDVRLVRIDKPYTMLFSKDKSKKLHYCSRACTCQQAWIFYCMDTNHGHAGFVCCIGRHHSYKKQHE